MVRSGPANSAPEVASGTSRSFGWVGVGTSIFGRPRRLSDDRRAACPYTLIWDEPVNKRFRPVCGGATLDVDYQANTLAVRVPRTCLKRPDWVRAAAMSANDNGDGSNTYYLDDAFSPSHVNASEGRRTWSAR